VTSIGLVLGGGGARAAYEAGVLRYIARNIRPGGKPVRFDVITGTSAGAINGAWMAAHAGEPGHRADELADVWASLKVEDIYRVRARDLIRPLHGATGGACEVALLDSAPMQELVRRIVPWPNIREAIERGHLTAFAVTTTELATSRNIVWIQGRPMDDRLWDGVNPFVRPRPVLMGPEHVLASASIPLLFPPVKVEGRYYVDGGLGQQTPLRPALRLGADRLLVISLRRALDRDEIAQIGDERGDEVPTWGQVIGKTMNSVLLDKSGHEVERLNRLNRLITWGQERYGEDFAAHLGEFMATERGAPVRKVQALLISPREDLGTLAIRYVLEHRLEPTGMLTKMALRTIARAGSVSENDLLSFILFDPGFLQEMLESGERDAAARADELEALFTV